MLTTQVQYPSSITEYTAVLMTPRWCFHPSLMELRASTARKDARGYPMPNTGGRAAVYKLEREVAPGKVVATAVKVFKYENVERARRYQAISDHLARRPSPYLVDFRYVPEGIR